MTFEIRKGVPVPSKGLTDTIRKMECGDSIVIPIDRRVAAHTSARSIGAKVRTRSNHDGTLTVWRIDPGTGAAHSSESIFDIPIVIKPAAPVVAKPPAPRGGPPPEWPKIAKTAASDGLPEGYYIRRDAYSPEIWVQGPLPEGPYSRLKKTLFDEHDDLDKVPEKTIFS
jgi:hypothetical protein